MTLRRVAAVLVLLTVAFAGCGGAASPSPAASAPASETPTISPSVEPSVAPSPSPSPSPSPEPSPTPVPTPPSAGAFWETVADGLRAAGHLRIEVVGPSAGELRYEPEASATAQDGVLVFVCVGGRAFDGQSGWAEVPGTWTCGADAIVNGFRTLGQPIDAWSADLPVDSAIEEAIALTPEGLWVWTYRASSPFSGKVSTIVTLDPATGWIVSAGRTDDTGETTYGISYAETFPPISKP